VLSRGERVEAKIHLRCGVPQKTASCTDGGAGRPRENRYTRAAAAVVAAAAAAGGGGSGPGGSFSGSGRRMY